MFKRKQEHFPGQHEKEFVRMILRKHWIIHFYATMRFIFVGILPAVGILYLLFTFLNLHNRFFPLAIAFIMLFLVFALLYTLVTWLNDDLDIIVVTNERVVDITQITLLSRNTSEAHLEQIQDVKGQIEGFLGTILNFGTVSVRTANDVSIFELNHVYDPIKNSGKITTFLKSCMHEKPENLLKNTLDQENTGGSLTKKPTTDEFNPKKFVNESRKRTLNTLGKFFKK